jgi:hypothetical protein
MLQAYRSKGDFFSTPELAGEVRGTGESRFVVQEHQAICLVLKGSDVTAVEMSREEFLIL